MKDKLHFRCAFKLQVGYITLKLFFYNSNHQLYQSKNLAAMKPNLALFEKKMGHEICKDQPTLQSCKPGDYPKKKLEILQQVLQSDKNLSFEEPEKWFFFSTVYLGGFVLTFYTKRKNIHNSILKCSTLFLTAMYKTTTLTIKPAAPVDEYWTIYTIVHCNYD